MRANCCALKGLQGHIRALCHTRPSRVQNSPQLQAFESPIMIFSSVVIVDFRDEVYASIAELLKHQGLITYRAECASELAGTLVSKNPELVLLNGTQSDESAWLTSAKLRIIDANRPVWIYSPESPSALDEWLSMARADDVIVYGGVLHRLLDLLSVQLSSYTTPTDGMANRRHHRKAA